MKLFGLFVWINDTPITGTVLSLSNIVEPRKELTDYKVGDLVSVRFSKFGIPKGIIGTIGDESMKKGMQAIIDDHTSFMKIIEETCPEINGQERELSTNIQELESPELHKESGKRKEIPVSKGKEPKKKPVTEKQAKINLEKAAEAQRMFEVEVETEKNRETYNKDSDDTSSVFTSAFNVLNADNAIIEDNSPQPVHHTSPSIDQTRVQHLEGKVNWLEMQLNQAWGCIYELQRNVQWLSQSCNQNQAVASTHAVASQSTPGNEDVDVVKVNPESTDASSQEESSTVDLPSDTLYNNYTKVLMIIEALISI
ncbi:uncharacterized protein LOC132723396 [Ruditapes philippinarum]|uniref:uncharacterized protein LOC132723396 n=1 Tax=Ruditapes philippinarum TaxID=129788 RepID=UPI00295C0738|nr:uncharacterized protein LOC132723396 [Ruditapes philippinarum]